MPGYDTGMPGYTQPPVATTQYDTQYDPQYDTQYDTQYDEQNQYQPDEPNNQRPNIKTQGHVQNKYRPVRQNNQQLWPGIRRNTEYIGCVENEDCLATYDSSVWMCSAKYSTRAMAINACSLIDSCHYIAEVTNGIDKHFELASKYSKCGYISTGFTHKLYQKEGTKPATVLEPAMGSRNVGNADRSGRTIAGMSLGCASNSHCVEHEMELSAESKFMCRESFVNYDAAVRRCLATSNCVAILQYEIDGYLQYELASMMGNYCKIQNYRAADVNITFRNHFAHPAYETGRKKRSSNISKCAKLSGQNEIEGDGTCIHRFGSDYAAELACSIDETCNHILRLGDGSLQLIDTGIKKKLKSEKLHKYRKWTQNKYYV